MTTSSITKWDIFHYVYAVLHHPEYRERYAANLRRELPRIPFVKAAAEGVGPGAIKEGGVSGAAGKKQVLRCAQDDKPKRTNT